jgi:hypothetical protein
MSKTISPTPGVYSTTILSLKCTSMSENVAFEEVSFAGKINPGVPQ